MTYKLPFLTKVSMWKSYLYYRFILERNESIHLSIEALFFIVSFLFLLQDLVSDSVQHTLSIFLLIVIIQALWDFYNLRQEFDSYFTLNSTIIPDLSLIEHILPSQKEEQLGFETIILPTKKSEKVFVSHTINRYIQTTPLAIHLSNTKNKKVRTFIEKHKEILLQYLNYYFFSSLKHNRPFTNEIKFCMSSDISLASHTVTCHTGGYYDSFLTNQITGTRLQIQDKKHTTVSTEEIFPIAIDDNEHPRLTDISSSSMNHQIGCSTLGFSKDHKWIIWVEGNANQFNQGLLITTGSGSVNASDIVGNDFQKTIIRGMERELAEESITKHRSSNQYQTLLLGFYRWISRGGKPEFIGITKLPENADAYRPNTKEVTTSTSEYIFSMPTIESLPKIITAIRKHKNLSVPLAMALYELEYMYEHHKKELEEFCFS